MSGETERTEAQLLTLLTVSPGSRGVSGLDVRDAVYSLFRTIEARTGGSEAEFGSLYWSSPAATSLLLNTWTKAAGTTVLGPSSEFSMPANNRLRHDDVDSEKYQVSWSGSITCGGNNQIVWIGLSKNGGTPPQGSWRPRKIGTGSDVGVLATEWFFELASTDYVEVWVKNQTSTATITIEQGALMTHKLT